MRRANAWAAAVGLVALLSGCAEDTPPAPSTPTVAVATFGATGDAESGPYALQLFGLSTAVATELGARTSWQVIESERVGTLEEELDYGGQDYAVAGLDGEDDAFAAFAGGDPLPAAPVEIARIFPTADYVLIGQLNGFDVSPVRAGGKGALRKRQNRIRSTVEFRIVDTRSRGWIASDTVVLDVALDDDRRAETQVDEFLRVAAGQIARRALQTLAGTISIEAVEDLGAEQRLRLSGGRAAGIETGDRFRVATGSLSEGSTQIEVTDVFADHALARNAGSALLTGASFAALPIDTNTAPESTDVPVRIALTPCLKQASAESTTTWSLTVRDRLAIYMNRYDTVELIEDRPALRDKLLGQQILDDLGKGREVGLPLGSLRGVDYVVVCNLDGIDVIDRAQVRQRIYDLDVVTEKEAQVSTVGSVYVIDVNSGATVVGEPVSSRHAFEASETGMADAADAVAQQMFAKVMRSLRPLAVALVAGDELTLNHKRDIGVQIDDEFAVFAPGSDVANEETGEILRNVGGAMIGTARVTGFDASGWIVARMISPDNSPVAGHLLRPLEPGDRSPDDALDNEVW